MNTIEKKPTQAERILRMLRDAGDRGVVNYDLMRVSYQYPARIFHLRHIEGHVIEREHIKDTEWRFYLKPRQPEQVSLLDVLA